MAALEVAQIDFMERRQDGSARGRKRAGEVLSELLQTLVQEGEEYVCVVAPHERLFSDHLCSQVRTLQEFPQAGCAWSDAVETRCAGGRERGDLCAEPEAALEGGQPLGFGRFLFRASAIDRRLFTALPYLDTLAMHLLFGASEHAPTRRCTLMVSGEESPGEGSPAGEIVPAALEREILIDISPAKFRINTTAPTPAKMTRKEQIEFVVDAAHSFPLPALAKKIAFSVYRFWLRKAKPSD
jgi:hypothetical protein